MIRTLANMKSPGFGLGLRGLVNVKLTVRNLSEVVASTSVAEETQTDNVRTLLVRHREVDGSNACRRLRYDGLLPGVLYGKDYPRHVLLTANRNHIEREIRTRKASFLNTLYRIVFEDDNSEHLVIPRTLQLHRYRDYPVACNFLGYDPERGMKIDIPIYWQDEEKSNGIKRGGLLNRVYWEVKCHVRGTQIPPSLGVSLSGKNIGHRIRWSEIKVPEGVTLIRPSNNTEADPVIATIKGKRSLMEAEEEES